MYECLKISRFTIKTYFFIFSDTTPPKNILNPESTLLDADCVPSIVLHFSYDVPMKEGSTYLKQDLFSKFTSPSLASVAAAKSR